MNRIFERIFHNKSRERLNKQSRVMHRSFCQESQLNELAKVMDEINSIESSEKIVFLFPRQGLTRKVRPEV